MKRIVAICAIGMFVFTSYVFAGGVGDCTQPIRTTSKYWGIGGAGEVNYVSDRYNDLENSSGSKDMKINDQTQVYGKLIIGIVDYFNLYLKAGGTHYDVEYVDRQDGLTYKVKVQDGIYAGAGFNGLLPVWKLKCIPATFGVGLDVQGNFSNNDINSMQRGNQDVRLNKGSFFVVDGQNSLYLTCKYDFDKLQSAIIPYVGAYQSWIVAGSAKNVSWSGGTSVIGVNKENKTIPPAYDVLGFGVLVGVDVDVAKFVNLNVEGRFVGETALTAGATLKF